MVKSCFINVIAGDGVGTSYSSLEQIGPTDIVEPIGQAKIMLYADVHAMSLIVRDHIVHIAERNGPLEFYLTYSSGTAAVSNRWHFSQDKRLINLPSTTAPLGQTITLIERDGHHTVLTLGANNAYYAPARPSGTSYMSFDGKQWVYINFQENCFEYYDAQGLLRSMRDTNGAETTYEYDANNLLSQINGPSYTGYQIRRAAGGFSVFMLNGSGNSDLCLVSYEFDAQGLLATTRLANGYLINYVHMYGYLHQMSQTDGTNMYFSFETVGSNPYAFNRMISGSFNVNIDYSKLASQHLVNIQVGRLLQRSVTLDAAGRFIKVAKNPGYLGQGVLAANYDVITYQYNAAGQVAAMTFPDNSQETFVYNALFSFLTQHTKRDGVLLEYVYETTGVKPKLLVENCYQDSTHAWTTRYAYDTQDTYAVLRFKITPQGCVTEYRVDPSTHLTISSRAYLQTRYSLEPLTKMQAPALLDLEAWIAKQDASQVALKEFAYNARGQLFEQSEYATVGADGVGVADEHMSDSQTGWTPFGKLSFKSELQIFGAQPVETRYGYDSMQRVTLVCDPLLNETTHTYLDAQQQIQIVRPNKRIELDTYDGLGSITDHKESITQAPGVVLTKETQFATDEAQRIAVIQDTNGVVSYKMLDQQQRLIFLISSLGLMTQYEYSRKYRYKKTTHYFNAVTQSQLFPFGKQTSLDTPEQSALFETILPTLANPEKDLCSYIFYDPCDRVRYEINADLSIQESEYDARGNLIAKIHYAKPITAAQLTALTTGGAFSLTPDPTQDQINYFFYNADDEQVGKQDAAGFVTEYCRDVSGRLTQEIRYATPSALASTLDLARPALNPVDDAHHYYFYDGRNQVILEVDAEGFITSFDHTPNGLICEKYGYYNPVDSAWYQNTSVPPAMPAAHTEDRKTIYLYDGLNRLLSTQCVSGQDQQKQYDAMGNITFVRTSDDRVNAADPKNILDADKTRDRQTRYDGFDRVVAEANPFVAQQLASICPVGTPTPQQQAQIDALWAECSLRYEYDLTGLKLKSTDTLNQTTLYYYDSDYRLLLTIDAEGAVVENTYNPFGKITKTRQYVTKIAAADLATLSGGLINVAVQAILTKIANAAEDPINQFDYDVCLRLVAHTDPEGYQTTKAYNALGQVMQENLPVESQTPSLVIIRAYDLRDHEVVTSKQANGKTIVTRQVFNNLYGKMTESTDALGNTTRFLYTRRGEQKQIIDPALVELHTYTRDAFSRVLTDLNAAGDLLQNQYAQATQTVLTIFQEKDTGQTVEHNVFTETIAETNALKQTQIFAHAADGKVSQIKDALGRVKTDVFNTEGFLVQHIDALNIKTAYFYNKAHYLVQKIEDTQGQQLTTTFVIDALGRQLSVTNPRNITNQSRYDRRGLCIQLIEDYGSDAAPGLRLMTQTAFNGQSSRISFIQGEEATPNQYHVVFQQDAFNRSVGKVVDPSTPLLANALQLTQVNLLDANNRIVVHTDPKAQKDIFFYDVCNKKRFKIDVTSAVTEWVYDKALRVIARKRYAAVCAAPAGMTDLAAMETWASANASVHDACTYFFYDHNSRERFTLSYVDVLGSLTQQLVVSESRYDGASRVIERIGYASSLDLSILSNCTYDRLVELLSNHTDAQDRHTYYVFDAAGQQRFLFDPESYAVEQVFDARGRIIQRIEYATLIPNVAALSTKAPEQIQLPKDSVNDRVTYYVFDVLDKPTVIVNSDSAVTYYKHDEMGNITLRCRFAKTITVPASYPELVQLLSALKPDATQGDRITSYVLDGLNRTTQITDAKSQDELFVHDVLGNLTQQTDRAGQITHMAYDRAKRLTLKSSPESVITTVSRDAQGKFRASQTTRAVLESSSYDPNNNVLQVVKDAGQPGARTMQNSYTPDNHLSVSTLVGISVDDPSKPADFNTLPVARQDLSVSSVYNTMGSVIVKQDKLCWTFNLYDARQALLYTINHKGAVIGYVRNAFGELLAEIKYATILTLDLSKLTETGISFEILLAHLSKDSNHDRTTTYSRDRRGDPIAISRDPVFYYYPRTPTPVFDFQRPTITYRKNAFRENCGLRYNRFPAYPQCDYVKLCFRGRTGQDLAEVESLQTELKPKATLDQTPMQYKVTRRQYNAFNEQIQVTHFATPLAQITPDITLAEIDQACVTSPQDRTKQRIYNLLGLLIEHAQVNVVRQQVSVDQTTGRPQMQDMPAATISKKFTYTATGLKSSVTNEYGYISYEYYDARGFKIAEADIINANDDAVLQTYGVDAHGGQVLSTYYINGTHLPAEGILPTPAKPDGANDQVNFYLMDERGLIQVRQQPSGAQNFSTYAPSRDVARQYTQLTTLVVNPADKKKAIPKVVIDETRMVFDPIGLPLVKTTLRDNTANALFTMRAVYNAFGETIAQGDGTTLPIFSYHDQSGRLWADNQEGGGARIRLFDLKDNPTAILQIPDQSVFDISKATPADLPRLVSGPLTASVENTSMWVEPTGKVLQTVFPRFNVTNTQAPAQVELCLQVSNRYPTLGATSIAWPMLACSYSLKLALVQYGARDGVTLMPKTDNGMTGVDVSALVSDQYSYVLNYCTTDPITQSDNIAYQTTGILSFDSGNNQGSRCLVATVEHDHVVRLVGNTVGVTQLQLYQGDRLLNVFTPTVSGAALLCDLNDVKDQSGDPILSGQYTIKGVRSGVVDAMSTLPFTVFTLYPSATPLSREISCAPQLFVLDDYGQLQIWDSLPEAYQNCAVHVICDYMANREGTQCSQTIEVTITPKTDAGNFLDRNGHILKSNIQFDYPVAYIISLTLSLILDDQGNQLLLCQQQAPILLRHDESKTIEYKHRGRSETKILQARFNVADDFESVAHPDEVLHGITCEEHEDCTVLSLADQKEPAKATAEEASADVCAAAATTTPKKSYQGPRARMAAARLRKAKTKATAVAAAPIATAEPDIIMVCAFAPITCAYITPIPGFADHPPTLRYLDVTQGPNEGYKIMPCSFANALGLVVNVSGMLPGNYPFTIGESDAPSVVEGMLCVTDGAQVFSSNPAQSQPTSDPQTSNLFSYDVFGNQVSKADAYGQVTRYQFNDQNKNTQIDYPPVTVIDEHGVGHPNTVTSKRMGFDKQGRSIGTTDENGHSQIKIFDALGNVLREILGDGTVSETNTYDLFKRKVTMREASGVLWRLAYDTGNRLLSKTSPLGLATNYSYDALDHRTSVEDPGGNTIHYGFDEQGHVAVEVDALGNLTASIHDRNDELLERRDANGNELKIERDYFGKAVTEILLSGKVVNKSYDQKRQLVKQTSQGGPAHQTMRVQQYTQGSLTGLLECYRMNFQEAGNQALSFHYSGGLLVEIVDITNNTYSRYGFDANRKRIHCEIVLVDQTVRTMDMLLDGRGRPISMSDTNAQLSIGYDAAGNRRQVVSQFVPCESSAEQWVGNCWSSFDEANRVLIDQGLLQGGVIQIGPGIGKKLTYEKGLRQSEMLQYRDGAKVITVTNTMDYDADARLQTTTGSNQSKTSRSYQQNPGNNNLQEYDEWAPEYSVQRSYIVNGNGEETHITEKRGGNIKEEISLDYDAVGNNVHQHVTVHQSSGQLDIDLATSYYLSSQYEEQAVSGYTVDPNGKRQVRPAVLYYDANDHAAAKMGADNGDTGSGRSYESESVIYYQTAEGWLLGKKQLCYKPFFRNFMGSIVYYWILGIKESIFMDPEGNAFASYLEVQDPANTNRAAMTVQHRNVPGNAGGRKQVQPVKAPPLGSLSGAFTILDPVQAIVDYPRPCTAWDYQAITHAADRSQWGDYLPNPMSSSPPIVPSQYTPEEDMSYAQISENVAGSEEYADVIAKANGDSTGSTCQAGTVVRIPPLQLNCSTSLDNGNYQQVMSVVIGGLSPHLEFVPKPKKKHCAETFFEAVISIVSIIVAPHLLPFISGLAGVNAAVGVGILAGVLDAGMQEVAKGVGLIKHFSWSNVLEAGASAGFMQTKMFGDLSEAMQKATTANEALHAVSELALYYGMMNISEQMALIALKQQKHLDLKQLIASMSQTILDNWVGFANHSPIPGIAQGSIKTATGMVAITTTQLMERIGLDLTESLLGSAIMGVPFDAGTFAANELGSYVGGQAGNKLVEHYAKPQSKAPAKSTTQIKEDSRTPHDRHYLEAVAAGQGKGHSPDFLAGYPGAEEGAGAEGTGGADYEHEHLTSSMEDTSNHPATQTRTRSQASNQKLSTRKAQATAQGARASVSYQSDSLSQLPKDLAELFDLPESLLHATNNQAVHFKGNSLNPDSHYYAQAASAASMPTSMSPSFTSIHAATSFGGALTNLGHLDLSDWGRPMPSMEGHPGWGESLAVGAHWVKTVAGPATLGELKSIAKMYDAEYVRQTLQGNNQAAQKELLVNSVSMMVPAERAGTLMGRALEAVGIFGKSTRVVGASDIVAMEAKHISPVDHIENFVPSGSAGSVRAWTTKARIKTAALPTKGKIRYVPSKNYAPSEPLQRGPNGGYIDRFNNEWIKGPSRTIGQHFEWDVQLSPLGQKQLGWATRDESHLNISLDGKITHR